MQKSKQIRIVWIVGIIFLVVFVSMVGLSISIPYDSIIAYAHTHRVLGAIVFGGLMFIATVVAPIAVLPLVPLIAPVLGPFVTGLSAYIGWVLGACVAFWLARRFGQPLVYRFVRQKDIEKVSSYMKDEMGFFTIVMLRLVLPVDALSYALGLFTTISYTVYVSATMVGVLWFSFVFAYMGDSFIQGNYVLLTSISVASVAIVYFSWRYIKKKRSSKEGGRV